MYHDTGLCSTQCSLNILASAFICGIIINLVITLTAEYNICAFIPDSCLLIMQINEKIEHINRSCFTQFLYDSLHVLLTLSMLLALN
uniref:Uncharacterized protein n=1 Tax=Anguilla anguilla TaxID=7936 RepID=A0A0E9RG79_ANGAN